MKKGAAARHDEGYECWKGGKRSMRDRLRGRAGQGMADEQVVSVQTMEAAAGTAGMGVRDAWVRMRGSGCVGRDA